jgi:hypothetical protein
VTMSSRIRGIALAACTATALSLMIAPVPAQAASSFTIKSWLNNGACIGISAGSTTEGTPAVVWSCNSHPDQQWHWGNSADYNGILWYQLVNGHNQCLGVSGGSTSAGAALVQWPCSGPTHPDQYWEAPLFTNCAGGRIIYNYATVQAGNLNVISTENGSLAGGTRVVNDPFESDCNSQVWVLPGQP